MSNGYDPDELGLVLGPEALRRLAQIDANQQNTDVGE